MGIRSATPKGAAAKVSAGRRRAARGCHARQAARTAKNKAPRMCREEIKAGRRLAWPYAKPETLAALAFMSERPSATVQRPGT